MILTNWLGRLASGLFKLAKRGGLERGAARDRAAPGEISRMSRPSNGSNRAS